MTRKTQSNYIDISQWTVAIFYLLSFVSLTFTFICSSYLQKFQINVFFSFVGADTPPVPSDFVTTTLGVHSFGDFLQPLWQSTLRPSPYLVGASSYPPAANGLFWLLSQVDFWTSFIIFQLLSISLVLVGLKRILSNLTLTGQIQAIVTCFLFTAPFINVLDRSNSQIFVIGLLLIAFGQGEKPRHLTTSLLLGLAIALKIYPILFLLYYLLRRHWKIPLLSALWALVFTVVPLTLFDGGTFKNLNSLIQNIFKSHNELSSLSLSSNNSLNALILSLKQLGLSIPIDKALISIMVVILILLLMLFTKRDFEILVLCSIAMCLPLDYVAPYALLVFFIPLAKVFSNRELENDRWSLLLVILIALLMTPKHLMLDFFNHEFRPNKASYMSVINPLLMILMMLVIGSRILASTGCRDQKKQIKAFK